MNLGLTSTETDINLTCNVIRVRIDVCSSVVCPVLLSWMRSWTELPRMSVRGLTLFNGLPTAGSRLKRWGRVGYSILLKLSPMARGEAGNQFRRRRVCTLYDTVTAMWTGTLDGAGLTSHDARCTWSAAGE